MASIAVPRHYTQAYPEPHAPALCPPSENSKPTQNNGHITVDLKEGVREKKNQREERRNYVREPEERKDTDWQNKHIQT